MVHLPSSVTPFHLSPKLHSVNTEGWTYHTSNNLIWMIPFFLTIGCHILILTEVENGDSVPAGVDSVAEKVDLVAASWNGSKSGLSGSKSGGSVRQTTCMGGNNLG